MSTQFTSNNPTSYFGILPTAPGQNWYRDRDPNTTDYKGYTIGDRWINKTALNIWALVGNAAKVATWVPLGGGGISTETLTPDVGAVVVPTLSNIDVTGDSAQGVSTTNAGVSTLQITVQDATTALKGVTSLATNAETIAGAVTTKAVTPDDLKAKLGPQTAHGVLIGEGTAVAVASTTAGTAQQILISNGAAADPGWFTIPSFSAYKSANTANATGNGTQVTLVCDTVEFNYGASYNAATGIFTAPIAGKYLFNGTVDTTNCTIAVTSVFVLVTTTASYTNANNRLASTANLNVTNTRIVNMAAGDTAYFYVANIGEVADTNTISGGASRPSSFSGSWIGQ